MKKYLNAMQYFMVVIRLWATLLLLESLLRSVALKKLIFFVPLLSLENHLTQCLEVTPQID